MRILLSLALASLALAAPAPAFAALHVVTTTEGLAAIAREVAGDRASVESLSRGVQDPHFVDANPILAVKLRGADLLVDVGLDLEIGWLPPLVNQSRNPRIQPGGPGRLAAASLVTVLDVPTGPVDRSAGDLHPGGNPHFLSDPRRAVRVATGIADRLAVLDPSGAASYRARADAFAKRMEGALARWTAQLAPVKGRALFTHHRTLVYFLDWTGLRSVGEMEPRPGTPPPPAHLAALVQQAKRDGVKACVVESYYDPRSDELVARLSGAKLVVVPGDVGGDPAAKGYEQWIDLLVARVTGALR
ncbi:MAG: metal ABC transporter substrate-binding protein [Anaeromyxobacteraceae bacterium]